MDKQQSLEIFASVRKSIEDLDRRVSRIEARLKAQQQDAYEYSVQRGKELGFTLRHNDDGNYEPEPGDYDTYSRDELDSLPF